ncbi:MAG: hypothetical protein PHT94_00010 [Candidatus Nanoarchaeia archaeon]|nr:hypothetical protein [Candidatus Nanoarchaeia archaeon]
MQDEINKELNELIRGELINYIIAELRNGYDLDSIKKVLHKKHREDLITQAIEYLKQKEFDLSPLDEKKENIPLRVLKESQDFDRILSDLKRYIRYKIDEGYEINDIKEALLRFGHYYDLIEHTINNIQEKEMDFNDIKQGEKKIKQEIINKKIKNLNLKSFFTKNNVSLLLMLIFTFIIANVTESPLFVVIYSFLPIYSLNLLLRYTNNIISKKILMIYILLFLMFYTINYIYEPFGMNINSIIVYNFVLFLLHFFISGIEIKDNDKKKTNKSLINKSSKNEDKNNEKVVEENNKEI